MKISIAKAVGFGCLFAAAIVLVQVASGMYMTYRYVPDIVEQYETVDYLQHKVSFGFPSDPTRLIFGSAFWFIGVAALGAMLYAGGSYALRRWRGKGG